MTFDKYIDLLLIKFEDLVDFKIEHSDYGSCEFIPMKKGFMLERRRLLNLILTKIYNEGYKEGSDYCLSLLEKA